MSGVVVSIVTPAFNEAANVLTLYSRIRSIQLPADAQWEWLVVDDHSTDRTFERICEMAEADSRVRGIRLAKNEGSHNAIRCGLQHVGGACAVVMAADLQDPPELIAGLMMKWLEGAQIVWAVRENREGESRATVCFARFYYWVMRRVVGIKEMPVKGADFFLLDRVVINAFLQYRESNSSVLALLMWMGFRQEQVGYAKQARHGGRSGWTVGKKLKLLVDSVTAFSYLPIRVMSCVGSVIALSGFLYMIVIWVNKMLGTPTQGWTELMSVLLFFNGLQMLMLGVLGEYVWRTLDESRRRPRFVIEGDTKISNESRWHSETGET